MLIKIEGSNNVRSYISKKLSLGRSLSRKVFDLNDDIAGEYCLIYPGSVEIPIPEDLNWGGVCSPSGDAGGELKQILLDQTKCGKKGIIFEHPLARRSDSFLKKINVKISYFNEDVFFCLSPENATPQLCEELIWKSNSGNLFSAFVVDWNSKFAAEELNEGDINEMARAAKKIVIAACDNETYIIWDRFGTCH